jgi:hypothetical protein
MITILHYLIHLTFSCVTILLLISVYSGEKLDKNNTLPLALIILSCPNIALHMTTVCAIYCAFLVIFYPIFIIAVLIYSIFRMACGCVGIKVGLREVFYGSNQNNENQGAGNQLKESILEKYEVEFENELFQTQTCVICMSDFVNKEKVVSLNCNKNHLFHKMCLFQWMKKNRTCPFCKKHIP